MASLEDTTVEELRRQLATDESIARQPVMTAIARKQGVPEDELADWFDVSVETIEDWIDRTVADVAGAEAGAGQPAPQIETDRRAEPEPLAPDREATVEFLDYQVLSDRGWSLDDEDLFEKADEAGLDDEDHGTVWVGGEESILEAAESEGFVWPYSCRGGACANCAAVCRSGSIHMPANQILPPEAVQERGVRLTCIGRPATTEIELVYNAKHLDHLEDILLPPQEAPDARRDESGTTSDSLL